MTLMVRHEGHVQAHRLNISGKDFVVLANLSDRSRKKPNLTGCAKPWTKAGQVPPVLRGTEPIRANSRDRDAETRYNRQYSFRRHNLVKFGLLEKKAQPLDI